MAIAYGWMETRVLSNSALSDTVGYAQTRLLQWRIALLWLLLVAALLAAEPGLSAAQLIAGAVFLALAVVLLRLWDDLADLPHDRAAHPQRVLVRSAHLGVFRALVAAGLPLLALLLVPDLRRLAIYGALLAVLAWLYHGPGGTRLARPLRTGLVLAKYPVLVFLAGAAPSGRTALVGLLLYALLAAHERLDRTA